MTTTPQRPPRRPTDAEIRRRTPLDHQAPIQPPPPPAHTPPPPPPHRAIAPLDKSSPRGGGSNLPAVAPSDNRTAVQRYLDDVAPASTVGRLIKFSKDGTFITHDDGAPVNPGAEFIVLADQTLIGWVKFGAPGEQPERNMGLLFDGFVMPPRETLGDLDPSTWETGPDGKPADPWQHHRYVVLQHTDTQELFTFTTSSPTGRRAVGDLLKHYTRMTRTHPDQLPVVRLGVGGFNHKDDRVGWVKTPKFVVVGRAPRDSAAKPDTSTAAYLEDSLPDDPIPF